MLKKKNSVLWLARYSFGTDILTAFFWNYCGLIRFPGSVPSLNPIFSSKSAFILRRKTSVIVEISTSLCYGEVVIDKWHFELT